MKLASVIIPVYKVEAYIAAAVQSVLDQTYQNIEIIIVNDGTPDNSRQICERFGDPRIQIIDQANRGVSAARNTGISQARGDFVAFLDGDDLWLPDKLKVHIQHLDANGDVGLSYSRCSYIDENGRSLGLIRRSATKDITPGLILCRNPIGNPSCIVLKKPALESIRLSSHKIPRHDDNLFFDEKLKHFEDVDFYLRIACLTDWKIEGVRDVLTLYRINSVSASEDFSMQLVGLTSMLQKTERYAPELTTRYGKVLHAYALRKFAQRALKRHDVSTARTMLHKALRTHRAILTEEPQRTLLVLFAIYLISIIPAALLAPIQNMVLRFLRGFRSSEKTSNPARDEQPPNNVIKQNDFRG